MTGYLVLMSNGPIAWKSGRQLSIALATSAAETVALMKVCVVTKHLIQMLFDFDLPTRGADYYTCGQQNCVSCQWGQRNNASTAKHVTVQSQYLTECVHLDWCFCNISPQQNNKLTSLPRLRLSQDQCCVIIGIYLWLVQVLLRRKHCWQFNSN